jgi:hypothetical protein
MARSPFKLFLNEFMSSATGGSGNNTRKPLNTLGERGDLSSTINNPEKLLTEETIVSDGREMMSELLTFE